MTGFVHKVAALALCLVACFVVVTRAQAQQAHETGQSTLTATAADVHEGSFSFGSYGRVSAATNLRGGTGRDADIVSRGSRIDEGTYAELELRRDDRWGEISSHIVSTLAVAGPLFHFNGDFAVQMAVRNLYGEVQNVFAKDLSFWAGSRMVRGDDIYLLDYWALDNLNLYGGGARYFFADRVELALHVGLARPNNPFYTQTVETTPAMGFTPASVLLLDRPRFVVGDKATFWLWNRGLPQGVKLVFYNEVHAISSGERQTDSGATQALPSDTGYVLGAQAGAYNSTTRSFANIFLRYAQGLAAYDPLGIPFGVGAVISTSRARELRVGFSANWELGAFGVQAGGLLRYFRDADPNVYARGSMTEAVLDVRPMVWFGNHAGLALDLSFQHRETSILDETTGAPEAGNAWKLGVIPFISPAGRGTYTRPQLRLIYALTARDAGARAMYPALDLRSQQAVEHFFGLGIEWWFNSTSYR